jgi:hypothetical protein
MSGNVGQLAFGIVGAVVGTIIAPGAGTYYGFMAGMAVGSVVFPTQLPGVTQEGPRLDDLKVQASAYGMTLPIMFGVVRAAGNMIWSTQIVEHRHEHTEEVGGKGKPSQDVTTVTYTYTVSCAVSICEGEIIGVRKIWGNKELFYNIADDIDFATNQAAQALNPHIRVYLGTEDQEPDPLIVATEGDAPGYRGTAYVVFENLPLEQFFNRIPNFEFEVVASGSRQDPVFEPIDYTPTMVDGGYSSTGGQWVTGSVTDDGLILAAFRTATYGVRLALINPYTAEVIRDFDYKSAIKPKYLFGTTIDNAYWEPAAHNAPVMNQRGDVAWLSTHWAWVWKKGGVPKKVAGFVGHYGVVVDEDGWFYAAVLDGSNQSLVRFDYGGTASKRRIVTLKPGTQMRYVFDSNDGSTMWISTEKGTDDAAYLYRITHMGSVMEKILISTDGLRYAASVAVAGDGSVWYNQNSPGELYRISPDRSTTTLIHTEAGAVDPEEGSSARLARDWKTGDILFNQGPTTGDIFRYAADGTLIQAYTGGDPVSAIRSNPRYPSLIVGFNSTTNSLGGMMFVEYTHRLSIETEPIGNVITALCGRVMDTADIDVSGLTADVRGYVIANRGPVRGMLEPLLMAYKLDGVESQNRLRFFARGGGALISIPEGDTGARVDTGEVVDPVVVTRLQEPELPHEVAINYLDATRDYQQGSQYARRLVRHSDNDTKIDLAVVLTPDEANELATAMLYEAWAARTRYAVPLPMKYAEYEPGDILNLQLETGDALVRMVSKKEHAGVIQAEAFGYEPAVYAQTNGNAPGGPAGSGAVGAKGPTNLMLLDTGLLIETDDTPGFYAAAGGYMDGWTGAKLYKSADDGLTYADTGEAFLTAATIGYANTRLGDFRGGNIFDELNTLEVTLVSGALSSRTEAQVLSGLNAAYMGGEIFTFKSAVLIGTKRYRLSGFLRGRLGTEWAIRLHATGEDFVLLSTLNLLSMPAPSSDIGQTRLFKAPSFGTNLAQAAPHELQLAANRLRPLSPVQIGGGRNAAGDVSLKWARRARIQAGWMDYIDVPLDESTEAYEIDIFAGAGKALTALTDDYPAQGTATAHGLVVGDQVHLTAVAGDLGPFVNDRLYTVEEVPSTSTFTLAELNLVGLPAYTSGGVVRKKARTITASAASATYTAAEQTTDYGGLQSAVHIAVYQLSDRVGRGYPGIASV